MPLTAVAGVRVEFLGGDYRVGPWLFVLDEHDCTYVLRGPDREPQGFRTITEGVQALIREGRLTPHQPFVPRDEVEQLVEEFERGVQHLVCLKAEGAGYEEAARIAGRKVAEMFRSHALRFRYDAYKEAE